MIDEEMASRLEAWADFIEENLQVKPEKARELNQGQDSIKSIVYDLRLMAWRQE